MNKSNLLLPKPKHFSLADWDYRVDARIEISTDQYISEPSSLRTQALDTGVQSERIYLGDTLGHNIPEGRLITWVRQKLPAHFGCWQDFRCQDIKYTTHPDNCYAVVITYNRAYLHCILDGIITEVGVGPYYDDLGLNTWYHFRTTFFQYIEANLHKYLRTIVEREIAGEWQELLNVAHEANKWADSDINRICFNMVAYPNPYYQWVDDTRIQEKTS